MFDLNQLQCFVAVAELQHFGRAATRLNMTQPPVSRQIQVLEHVVGTPLLDRTSRSVCLTAAGRSFLPEAKRILKLADSATQLARRIAMGKTGFLKIGFTAAAAYSFLPDLVAACRARLPEVDLSLKEMVSGDQFEALTSELLDVGLLRPPAARPGFVARRVAAESLMGALSADHPLAARAEVTLADFHDQPFVMYSPHEARYFHDLLVAQFSGADVLPRYVQHLNQIHSILAMVRAGLGVSIVPAAAANLSIVGVKLLPLKLDQPVNAELFMTWRRDDENPLLRTFIRIATELAASAADRECAHKEPLAITSPGPD